MDQSEVLLSWIQFCSASFKGPFPLSMNPWDCGWWALPFTIWMLGKYLLICLMHLGYENSNNNSIVRQYPYNIKKYKYYYIALTLLKIRIHYLTAKWMVPLTQIIFPQVPTQLQLMTYLAKVEHGRSQTSGWRIGEYICPRSKGSLKTACQLNLLDIGDPPFLKESFS